MTTIAAYHIDAQKLLELVGKQQEGGGGGAFVCGPEDEEAIAKGQARYFYEQCEIIAVDVHAAQGAEKADHPESTRKEVVVTLRASEEGEQLNNSMESNGTSPNAGSSMKCYFLVQDPGPNEGHNKMTEISQGRMGSIVFSALGINEENIGTLRMDEDTGAIDLTSYFVSDAGDLDGKWVWGRFKRYKNTYTKDGETHENIKTEFDAAIAVETSE